MKNRKKRVNITKKTIKPKTNIISIIITIFLIIVAISLMIFIFIISGFTKKIPNPQLSLSEEIRTIFFNDDLTEIYISLIEKNYTSNQTNAKVRFVIKNSNGTEYYYSTNSTIKDILLSEVSIPAKTGILDFFIKNIEYKTYNFAISSEDFGIDNFQNITYIGIIFEIAPAVARNITQPSQNTTNRTTRRTPPPSPTDSNPTNPTNPSNCTNSPWTNQSYRCAGTIREVRQTRTLCNSGNIEERWESSPCFSGYKCYEGAGAPSDRCINSSFSCTDSDSGINSTINGFVNTTILNVSSIIYNDSCSQSNNLTEYYCFFDTSGFQAKNETFVCAFGCSDGACLVCIDNDNDGYSTEGGECGVTDCNDSNSGINPGAVDICGNGIDEDCSGSDKSCIDLQNSLVAYWKFNDSLDDGIANDETGNNNGTCSESCPTFNPESGLNNSGAYEFNGVDNHLNIPPTIFNNNTFSISAWINPSMTSIEGMIIYSNAGSITAGTLNLWYSRALNSISIYNNYGLDSQSEMDSIEPNKWSNIILIYDYPSKQARLYINSALKITDTNFSQTPAPSNAIIGAKGDMQKYFSGYMSNIRVYNRTLSDAEISEIYIKEAAGELPTLSLWERIIGWFRRLLG